MAPTSNSFLPEIRYKQPDLFCAKVSEMSQRMRLECQQGMESYLLSPYFLLVRMAPMNQEIISEDIEVHAP